MGTATQPHDLIDRGHVPPSGASLRRRRALLAALAILCVAAAVVNAAYFRAAPWRRHLDRGVDFAAAGKPRDAEREWRDALRTDPSHHEPYQLLARLYLDTDRPALAIPLLERLRQIAPRTPHTLCGLADAYTRADRVKDGLDTARQAVVMEPNCARAHALLGIQLGDALDTRSAVAELEKAAALAPDDDKIVMSLAQAYLDASNVEGAERLARRVIARSPNYATAWYTLGRSYARRSPTPDNLREAIGGYAKAVELNPAIADGFSELGRLQILAGDPRSAVESLEHVWQRGVRSKEIAYNLASAYRKLGMRARANELDAIFKKMSDYEERHEALMKHLQVDPRNVEVALQLAELDAESGDPAEALAIVRTLLQARPRDTRALKTALRASERLKADDLAASYRKRIAALPGSVRSAQ